MSNFIENGVYGYKNNRLANGEFNRCQYVYKNGEFIKLNPSHTYFLGTFEDEIIEQLVLIKENFFRD